jgi:hypothetical protein
VKKIFLAIVITALLTWEISSVFRGLHTATERLWLISAIKAPGRMAIDDIQASMGAGQYKLAEAKLQALKDTWQRFDHGPDSSSGPGIGDIMVTFSKLDSDYATNNAKPPPTLH